MRIIRAIDPEAALGAMNDADCYAVRVPNAYACAVKGKLPAGWFKGERTEDSAGNKFIMFVHARRGMAAAEGFGAVVFFSEAVAHSSDVR